MKALLFRPSKFRLLASLFLRKLTGKIHLGLFSPLQMVDLPENQSEDLIGVKPLLAGICGSDLRKLRISFSLGSAISIGRGLSKDFILGHEMVGEVTSNASNSDISVGDKIVFLPGWNCKNLNIPECDYCQKGMPLLCINRHQSNSDQHEGVWTENLFLSPERFIVLPKELKDEDAVLIEPLACAIHTILRRAPQAKEKVLIIGAGTIGLSILMCLKAMFPDNQVCIQVRYDYQYQLAKELGADLVLFEKDRDSKLKMTDFFETQLISKFSFNEILELGADIVYDCVGNSSSLKLALRSARPRGAVIIEGISSDAVIKDASPVWLREVDIIGSHGHGIDHWNNESKHSYEIAVDLIKTAQIKPGVLLSHIIDFKNYKEGIRIAESKNKYKSVKVALKINA